MKPKPVSDLMPVPVISSPYTTHEERDQHLRIMGRLAIEVQRSVDEIQPLYEDIFAHMKNTASIQDYLPIFVSRRVKALFF